MCVKRGNCKHYGVSYPLWNEMEMECKIEMEAGIGTETLMQCHHTRPALSSAGYRIEFSEYDKLDVAGPSKLCYIM